MARVEKKNPFFTKGAWDYGVFIVVMIILAVGLIMVLSASAPSSLSESGDSYKYFTKQLISAIVGVVAMIIISTINYNFYKNKIIIFTIYVVALALNALTIFMGSEEGGAVRWLRIGPLNFQPSELAKAGLIFVYASILSDIKKAGNTKKFWKGFVMPLIWLIPFVLVIFKFQNHFSAVALIGIVTCAQMFIVGVPIRYFLLAGVAAIGGYFSLKGIKSSMNPEANASQGFRSTRIETWKDPFKYPTGDGWQIIQSLYAIASGGLFGLGFGESRQKYLYLPEPHNDFIFAVLAEETGFLGCITVILLFIIFIWRGIVIAMKAPDTFGSLIAIGITVLIGIQAVVNVAVVTGTIPVTGMPLPFFSYGGTSLVVNLILVGVLLNISRSCSKK